jgi:Tol biopolymer transport system component
MLIVAAPAASASFPGRNGKLAVVEEGCPGDVDAAPRYINSYGPGGDELGPLTDCTVNSYAPDWSPRGTRLAFTRSTDDATGLFSQKADGTDLRSMNIPTPGESFDEEFEGPSYSPSGQRVVFQKNDSIWTSKTDGTGMKRLLKRPCKNCLDILTPRWAPRGGRIAFVADGAGKRSFKSGIWVMSAKNGKHRRRLTSGGFEPDWAPNGKRLVYRSTYENQEEGGVKGGNLYVVRLKGARKRRVLHTKKQAATVPAWSPNGKFIAYIGMSFGAGDVGFDIDARLMRIRAKGGGRKRLADVPDPFVEEGFYRSPDLAWQAKH